jgi:hypothetical protein
MSGSNKLPSFLLCFLLCILLCAGAGILSACAPGGLQDQAQVNSVRILVSAADKPYAKPGDTVNLQVLAFDGRANKPAPMTVFWLPVLCENPKNDAYYACFQQLAAGGSDAGAPSPPSDAGAGAGVEGGAPFGAGAGPLKPGIDLTPFLPTGPSYQFKMPEDAVTSHPMVKGVSVPYGLVIVFNVACAGHVELIPLDPNNPNPQQIPLGCFDAHHNQLGPDDWVFGFTRVFAYENAPNTNPVIQSIDAPAQYKLMTSGGPIAYTSTTLTVSACSSNCKDFPIGPVVPAKSQEVQTQLGSDNPPKEEIWAEFYSTFGKFKDNARLLYDSTSGSLGGPDMTDNRFTAPDSTGSGTMWIVVHDNRGGAAWVTIPIMAN